MPAQHSAPFATRRYSLAVYPLHAVFLAGMIPLFLGAMLSDIAYASSYHIQWNNFASWLISGGLVFAGIALVLSIVDLILTRLRDADGDGAYELTTTFADDLNAPYGLALIDNHLYVANQDALVRFEYEDGQTKAKGAPQTVTPLPAEINHHWTKAMTASADGQYLYVGIGSNSNITERGMTAEADRAMVWRINAQTGEYKRYATGLRNPTALTIHPDTGQLWAVVNERDEIGPNLVPDYLTSVVEGGFYGWPFSYWGQNVDDRVRPQRPDKVAEAIIPDYSLGAHVAALGVDFSIDAMGADFANGVFVGEHGSWNRKDPVGYRVSFVRFENGRPTGEPIAFVTGFRDDDGTTRGRPVGVTVDPRGALIVADDLSNIVWRVTPTATPASDEPEPTPAPAPEPEPASAVTAPEPERETGTEAGPESAPESESVPEPGPEAESVPESVSESGPEPESGPESGPEPVPEPAPEPELESEPGPEPAPGPEPDFESAPQPEPAPEPADS